MFERSLVWTWLGFVLLTVSATTAAVRGGEVAAVHVGGTSVSLTPSGDYALAILRVAGPDGYRASVRSDSGPVVLDLLADRVDVTSEDAVVDVPAPVLTDGGYRYEAVFYDSERAGRWVYGQFRVEGGAAFTEDDPDRRDRRASAADEARRKARVRSSSGEEMRVAKPAFTSNDSITIEDDVGDGYTSLLLKSATPLTSPGANLQLYNSAGLFQFTAAEGIGTYPILTLQPDFRLGLGTTQPEADLHLFTADGNLRLTDYNVCPNAAWEIDADLDALMFEVVPGCAGDNVGGKMWLRGSTGNLGIGTNVPDAKLHVAGSGIIEGDVALGSSRTIKHGLEPVDSAEILEAVRALSLYRWKYNEDPVQATHVGPMAEDVHAAFGVGRDERHLSPADSAGLSLAAIQGVDERLDREIGVLRERLAELEARLEATACEAAIPNL